MSVEFHYTDDDFQIAKGMTKAFNQICSEEKVQCTVTLHPQDFRSMYTFVNLGDKRLQIMYDEDFWVLVPEESLTIAFPRAYPVRPYIIALEEGIEAGWK